MPILTISTAAGSAGKSTTAVSLAALLAQRGRHVVMIDTDPQSDGTIGLGIDPYAGTRPTIASVLMGKASLEDAVQPTECGVNLIQAVPSMSSDLAELAHRRGRDLLLRRSLAPWVASDTIVIIDCPGDATNVTTTMAICAATHVVSTTYPSRKESKGLVEIENVVTEFANVYSLPTEFAAVIPCSVQPPSRNATAQGHLQVIRDAYGPLVTPPVRWSELVSQAYDSGQPLPLFAPGAPVVRDYIAVLDYLTTRGIL